MIKSHSETKKSVLVLEDDPQWQRIVSHVLRNVDQDIQIRCVPTTQAALDLIEIGERFDLVVADQYLDGALTGLDFYRHLRGRQDQTSFVMLSGLGSTEFHDLTVQDIELPTFVQKSKASKNLRDVLKSEIGSLEAKDAVAPAHRHESSMLLMILVSAAVFTGPILTISSRSTPITAVGPNHFNAVKATVLTKERMPANVIVPPRKQHDFVGQDVRAAVGRIAHRADVIDETVSRQ